MKKKILIIGILLLVVTLGITYAWWRWQSSTNTNVTFTIEGATITYNAGNNISGIKLIPVSTKEKGVADNTAVYKEITASSNSTMYLTLNLDLTTFPSALADQSLVWEIYKGTTKIGNGNFANKAQGDTITLFTNQEINSTQSLYKLYIWIDGNQDNLSTMMNQSFVFHLNAEATDEAPPSSVLPDFILNSNAPLDSVNSTYVAGTYESYTVSNEDKATLKAYLANNGMSDSEQADQCIANEGSYNGCLNFNVKQYNKSNDPDIELIGVNPIPGINFRQNASDTNGKGLYIRSGTENNLNPIYYYRGAVDNNNVYFANFCWKIVRTTETGGLKMIYNGAPTNGACGSGVEGQSSSTIGKTRFNRNYTDAKYVGYTYDNNGIDTDSTIKGAIDTWYQTNILTNYDNYIEDTVYCNDRSIASASELEVLQQQPGSNIQIAYKPTVRYELTGMPNLGCTNNADKYTKSSSIGNGKLQYPVGLLTVDEIWLAGMSTSGTNNYLNNNSSWWSLSPSMFNNGGGVVWYAVPARGLDGGTVDYSGFGARPALSLKPEYNTFGYGNGTVSNPYRFVETIPSN